ncbi:DNA polymerase I [Alkanindiges sp. WGS2144]|uniref:DNA polymerase I n=1 Tax=Alkanindiges sp. WGS2144 TaxID=3366808 RepID=UPI003750ED15
MKNDVPPFVLVDGSYYLFRAFHALPPLTTSTGLTTNAVRGALSALQKLMRRIQPTHMAVVFDTPEPTFRHKLSPDYKGDRPSMPPELAEQIPYLHAVIRALGIPLLTLPGVEADDLMGTLTKRACQQGHHVLISTGDKDMAQLVNDCVNLEDSFRDRLLDTQGVFDKFGVWPHQIVDYLTLMGDASDGIKGIPGVGTKTAAKLLQEYDNIAGILDNLDKIKGKLGQNIREHQDSIPLNHQLASIICDLPVGLDWTELKLGNPDTKELHRLYTELEFRSQLQSLEHPNNPDRLASQSPTQDQTEAAPEPFDSESASSSQDDKLGSAHYHTILTQAQFDEFLARLQSADHFVIDTETTSLDYRKAQIVGLSVAFDAKDAFYIPLAHDYLDAPQQLNRETILEQLKPYFENPAIGKIGHHLKYDAHVFKNHGIDLKGWVFDTMLASYVLNPTATRHGMDDVARLYLSHLTITFEDIAGKGAKQLTFNQVPLEQAAPYACEDAHVTYRLYEVLARKLKAQPELEQLLLKLELPVAQILTHMECCGIKLDTQFLAQLGEEFSGQIELLEKQVIDMAGQSFNVSSPKQLGEILFDKIGIAGGKKTASGQYATGEAVLEKIDHPIAALVLEHRGLCKLKSTYTDRLIAQADTDTCRVHTSYHQAVTATGRLSSSDPNLQNIPIRGQTGRQIRKAFIAPKGRVLLAADYSQIELRLMAHFSQDEALLRAFKLGQDIHQATAAEVLGLSLEEVTSDQRRQAKTINFGLLYGMSSFGLSKQLKLSRQESQSYINQYFARYPGVYEYMQRTRKLALEQGFVETLMGRKLYTPDVNARNAMVRQAAERAAINAPLQGSAADIIKLAMIAVNEILPKDQALLLLQVHDELVFEVDAAIADTLAPKLSQVMQEVVKIDVPLLVEIGKGCNWEDAHG